MACASLPCAMLGTGSGGMSTVYLAKDSTLDRDVAVKVMHREMSEQADQLERFRQEARAVAKLSHPNVVAVIDAGEDGGREKVMKAIRKTEVLSRHARWYFFDPTGHPDVVVVAGTPFPVGAARRAGWD